MGYGFDKLINYHHSSVRLEVIEQGYISGYDYENETNYECYTEYYDLINKIKEGKTFDYINKYGFNCHILKSKKDVQVIWTTVYFSYND